jgi:hypothetical protein
MPLGQIDLRDNNGQLFVAIANNGIGPLIINHVVYVKGDIIKERLSDFLTLNLQVYNFLHIGEGITKVVAPNTHLRLFEITFEGTGHDVSIAQLRQELSQLSLNAVCKDIYNNKIRLERNLKWFARHS